MRPVQGGAGRVVIVGTFGAVNPWLQRRVLNYAHRGGALEAPSSTLFAMRQALAAGAHALELDVHATADRQLVVCHDETVDGTTDGTGRIADLTLDEIQALDNAVAWDEWRGRAPADRDFAIPTLTEVLEAFPAVYLNLDIKETAPAVEPYEQLLADALRQHERRDDVIVASFHDEATDAFAALAPEFSTSYGTAATAAFYFAVQSGELPPPTRHHALQVPSDFEGTTVVDEVFVAAAHELGVAVHVWTIDAEPEMERLLDLGVDGIMTDRPSVLATVLRRRGAC